MTAAAHLVHGSIEVEVLPAVGARLHRLLTASKGALAWLPAGESLSLMTELEFRRTEEDES
jgi:hypothetical protein